MTESEREAIVSIVDGVRERRRKRDAEEGIVRGLSIGGVPIVLDESIPPRGLQFFEPFRILPAGEDGGL